MGGPKQGESGGHLDMSKVWEGMTIIPCDDS